MHDLDEAEHLIGAFILCIRWRIGIDVVGVEELHNVEAALVHIEMYVALFKVGRACLPDLGFRIERLYRVPRGLAYALTVRLGRHEQYVQMIVTGSGVYVEYRAAHLFAVGHDAICVAAGGVYRVFYGLTGDYLAISVDMIVARAEFLKRAVLERQLIVKYKLFAVVFGKGARVTVMSFMISYLLKK